MLYFNDCVISFRWEPFFGLYLWKLGTQDSMLSLDEIQQLSWNGNPGEEAPVVISPWDAGERGRLIALVNLPPADSLANRIVSVHFSSNGLNVNQPL